MIFSFKRAAEIINVELKIIGMINGEYASIIETISLPRESSLKGLVREAYTQGRVPAGMYSFIKGSWCFASVLINGEQPGGNGKRVKLNDGDRVLFFYSLSGG